MRARSILVIAILILMSSTGGWAQEVSRPVIAVVPFANDGGANLAGIIERDLTMFAPFVPLPPERRPQTPTQVAEVDWAKWQAAGVTDLVIGEVIGASAHFYLLDVSSKSQVIAFAMPDARPDQLPSTAHQISDLIHAKRFGRPGIAASKLVYVSTSGTGSDRIYQLMVSDYDGQRPVRIAQSREPLMSPAWSPDRKRIAFVGCEHGASAIYVYELASGRVQKVIAEKGINGSPAWSPDGTRLAVTLSYGTNPDIFVIDLAARTQKRLSDSPGIDTEASWSPDGRMLYFVSERDGPTRIYRVSADGGAAEPVAGIDAPSFTPRISPDGRWLAFAHSTPDHVIAIWVLDLQSQHATQVGTGPHDTSPSWAPNSEALVYADDGRLEVTSVDGRQPIELPRQAGDLREPSWSPQATSDR